MYVRDREGAHSRDFLIWNQQLYLSLPLPGVAASLLWYICDMPRASHTSAMTA